MVLAVMFFTVAVKAEAGANFDLGLRAYDEERFSEAAALWRDAAEHGDVAAPSPPACHPLQENRGGRAAPETVAMAHIGSYRGP